MIIERLEKRATVISSQIARTVYVLVFGMDDRAAEQFLEWIKVAVIVKEDAYLGRCCTSNLNTPL